MADSAGCIEHPANGAVMQPRPLDWSGFFLGGFECSTARRRDGRRLDLIAATGHDRCAAADYAALIAAGCAAARDGLRWHLIEDRSGHHDWSSFLPMLRAANQAGLPMIWDLCHFGWPDHLDIWQPRFIDRFAQFAAAAARIVQAEGGPAPAWCPINEISFWAWAGGDESIFMPCAQGRSYELKRQLVRATIAAIDAIRSVDPAARFIAAEPLIHVVPAQPEAAADAEGWRNAQFQALDWLGGLAEPQLGGDARYLDIVGVNFYPGCQWELRGATLARDDTRYRPLADMLQDVADRYRRPLLIAETGAEGDARGAWLDDVCDQVAAAQSRAVDIRGICLYPIQDYPGWLDDRHCPVGLFGPPQADGQRPVHAPLAAALCRQQRRFHASAARG